MSAPSAYVPPWRRLNWPLLPPVVAVVLLLLLPMALVVMTSLRRFVPGFVGGVAGRPFEATLDNYAVFLHPAYLVYLKDTLWLSFVATAISLCAAYPISYWLATVPSSRRRRFAVSGLMVVLYASAILKVYSVALVLGPTGYRDAIAAIWGVRPTSRLVTSTVIEVGLVNFLLPIAALILVGPIQQVNPSLAAAAQSLGANRLMTHLTVIVPICLGGIAEVFTLIYAASVGAFIIPAILGRGQIVFLSNLVFARFSDISNFPGGAALSVLLLVITLSVTLGLGSLLGRWAASHGPS